MSIYFEVQHEDAHGGSVCVLHDASRMVKRLHSVIQKELFDDPVLPVMGKAKIVSNSDKSLDVTVTLRVVQVA